MYGLLRRIAPAIRFTVPHLIAFSCGVCALLLFPTILSPVWLVLSVVGLAGLTYFTPASIRTVLAWFCAGFLWANLQAHQAMMSRLPRHLEGQTLVAEGRIDGLPEREGHDWRFRFCPESIEPPLNEKLAGCWRLRWTSDRYRLRRFPTENDATVPEIKSGERWRLVVRLRRPRGLMNPGGFDAERRALETGTTAIGYVESEGRNLRLTPASGIGDLRIRIAARIELALPDRPRMSALLRGLVVGDRRGFEGSDWQVLRSTGTTHLFSISGLHVSMIALVVAGLIMALTRIVPASLRWRPRRLWAIWPAAAAATAYSILAGFEVPTQRSLAMVLFAAVVLASRRSTNAWQAWSLAMAAILLVDPLAMLSAGFWLSYLGVALLLLAGLGRPVHSRWRTAWRTQAAVVLGLMPVGMAFFSQVSWVAVFTNIIAIPWVTFAVVPLALLALPLMLFAPISADALLQFSALLLDGLMRGLDWLAAKPGTWSWTSESGLLAVAGAVLAAVMLMMPMPFRQRLLALPLAIPLLLPSRAIEEGQAVLHVLDIGQGTAVVVQTRRHAMLFDAGPAVPDGFDAGEQVVVPALRALGIGKLDALIASHADNDHAGGVPSVLRELPVARIFAGESMPGIDGESCREEVHWVWDGVEFRFLHPPKIYPVTGNDRSCVLKISAGESSALLTGDAGVVAEMRLLALHADQLRSDVLLLGHHGSNTSSSAAFLMAVNPVVAIATVGYRNRFAHPDERVRRRLAHHGIPLLETARTGALKVLLGKELEYGSQRERRRRFWNEP